MNDTTKVTLWLDHKIEIRIGFYELTYTLFLKKEIDLVLSICKLRFIDHRKMNGHEVLL